MYFDPSCTYILPDFQSFRIAIGRASRIAIAYRSFDLPESISQAWACDSRKYESVGSESERDWKCKLACGSFVTRCEKLGSRQFHVTEHGRPDRLTMTSQTFLSPPPRFALRLSLPPFYSLIFTHLRNDKATEFLMPFKYEDSRKTMTTIRFFFFLIFQ